MKILIPGHRYEVATLDDELDRFWPLQFVMRQGKGYPGNIGTLPGTNLQELWRTEIDRLKYLNWQEPHPVNMQCVKRLRQNIEDLEVRAALRHGRYLNLDFISHIEYERACLKCGHIQCNEDCK